MSCQMEKESDMLIFMSTSGLLIDIDVVIIYILISG